MALITRNKSSMRVGDVFVLFTTPFSEFRIISDLKVVHF